MITSAELENSPEKVLNLYEYAFVVVEAFNLKRLCGLTIGANWKVTIEFFRFNEMMYFLLAFQLMVFAVIRFAFWFDSEN